MRWDDLVERWTARLLADPALLAALGGNHLYPGQASRPVKIPSVEYLIVGDRETELFDAIRLQVDIFARGLRKAATIERRIRILTHRDVAQDLDGERGWMRYVDSRSVGFPSDPGVVHRILDFDVAMIREMYLTP